MKTQYANLPTLLKKEGLFCLWQYEVRDGKKRYLKSSMIAMLN